MAGGKAGKDSGKVKQKAVSRSARAGLQFPVGRLEFDFDFEGGLVGWGLGSEGRHSQWG